MMHNRRYAAEIAHNVSAQKRKVIVERAREVGLPATSAASIPALQLVCCAGNCRPCSYEVMKKWCCICGTDCVSVPRS